MPADLRSPARTTRRLRTAPRSTRLIRGARATSSAFVLLLLCVAPMGIASAQAPAADKGPAAPPAAAPAQGAQPPAAAPAPAGGGKAEPQSLLDLVLASGESGVAFMIVLGLFSLTGATVALERLFAVRRNVLVPAAFVSELRHLAAARPVRIEALRALSERGDSPIAKILAACLLRLGRPVVEVEKSMEDAAARELSAVRARIRPLSVVGNIAPLVGLLGTVVGMIEAFRVASQEGLGKGQMMAEGIYLALLTTAAGLVIAIPAMILSAFFNARAEKFFREIDEHVMSVLPVLTRSEAPHETDPASGSRALVGSGA